MPVTEVYHISALLIRAELVNCSFNFRTDRRNVQISVLAERLLFPILCAVVLFTVCVHL